MRILLTASATTLHEEIILTWIFVISCNAAFQRKVFGFLLPVTYFPVLDCINNYIYNYIWLIMATQLGDTLQQLHSTNCLSSY